MEFEDEDNNDDIVCGVFLLVERKDVIVVGVLVVVVMVVMFLFVENMVKFVNRIIMDIMSFGVYVNICWNSYIKDECIF